MTVNLESFWDRVVAKQAPGAFLSGVQREELRRRVADAEAHPEDYVEWSDALANTLKRLRRDSR